MFIKQLTAEQKQTRQRIIEISFRNQYPHLGSCLSAVDLVQAVYSIKKPDEKFILSNGHAGLALYVVLEKYGLIKDPKIFEKLHVHPERNIRLGISVSTGSLGQGLPIALGIALATRSRNVYCMISDGECTEGSIWESLRLAGELKISNLKIILNANGWGAYSKISLPSLIKRLKAFNCELILVDGSNFNQIIKTLERKTGTKPLLIFARTSVYQLPFLKDQDAHYYVMNEQDYLSAKDFLL